MIGFKEILEKLNIKDEKIFNKNIETQKIVLEKETMTLSLYLKLYEEFDDECKNIFESALKKSLKEFEIKVIYLKDFLEYDDEISLIRGEILKYNSSSLAWIDSLNLKIDKVEKTIYILTSNQGIQNILTKNGLKENLIQSLKTFGNYSIFIELEENDATRQEQHQKVISDIQNEEKKLKKEIEILKPIKKEKEKKSNENNGKYSFGRFKECPLSTIGTLDMSHKYVCIEADVFDIEVMETKNNKYLISFSVTDYTSSIVCKNFLKEKKDLDEMLANVKEGTSLIVLGTYTYDQYKKQNIIMFNYLSVMEKDIILDLAEEKRVELKLHTRMTYMNGVNDFSDFAKRASIWGMDTLAITDIDNVQGYPDAMDAAKKYGLKILYGMDANFVDDKEPIVINYTDETPTNKFVVFDIETTGFSPRIEAITEIGAVKIIDGHIVDRFSQLVNPQMPIPYKVTEITGIDNQMVKDEPTIDKVIIEFDKFCKGTTLVAHNAKFDISFIRRDMLKNNLKFDYPILDTLPLARALVKDSKRFNLGTLAKKLGVSLVNAHRAVNDAEATAEVFIKMLDILKKEGPITFELINKKIEEIDSKLLFENSVSILVENQTGLKNLYKLVSESHLKYVSRVAKTPRSLIDKYRQGLLIGSGNSSSELFRAVLNLNPQEDIEKIASCYDYIELQTLDNNKDLIVEGLVESYEDIKNINKSLYEIGKKLNIPVVATGDVFYLEEKDDLIRRIALSSQIRPPKNSRLERSLYFRTTQEMLEDFSYLGKEAAKEVVVTNSRAIADRCDFIKPIPDGTFPPVIEGSEDELRKICYEKAHSVYGDNLPSIVEKRIEKELNSIISNGYAVLYIIAQKLVTKSNKDGYLVGSRGSVGSSFAATMSSITEVNPLPPHYICEKCKYSEFIEDGSYGSGVDLPDKNCPECGSKLIKEGHDIPFEVFLGFNGDKEPDIDLNFAGEYQPTAHKYAEEIFGQGYVFRAGTIGTIAEKTAFGYVSGYFEEEGINSIEKLRLAKSLLGIKRTSGQHPGGIMICPRSNEIYDFTPIQHPADDLNSEIITTHFDYNFIHGKILKLDILGHDGPSIIKMLEDLTNTNASDINLADPDTMSLFSSPDKLKIDLDVCPISVGTLGIPEFGTSFVKQMLEETCPKDFSGLVRISGLSHGTDVWTNNAQELVNKGKATLSDVISTREDIMLYLIRAGAKNKMAFDTMEKVRKGKGLTLEQEEIMKELPLPEWYIDACKKIKYMFPKAHAVAYVMLSFRIAYYKLNYPLAFYATYFTTKLVDFNGQTILGGIEAIKKRIEDINIIGKTTKLKQKEKSELTVLEVALEMLARGFEFEKPNIYKSWASNFDVVDRKVLMPLRIFSGMGENVANNIIEERAKGEFISIEDLVSRTKATKSVVEILKTNNLLNNLPESNQVSLFNMMI